MPISAGLAAVTEALAMAPPLESLIVPCNPAVVSCANSRQEPRVAKIAICSRRATGILPREPKNEPLDLIPNQLPLRHRRLHVPAAAHQFPSRGNLANGCRGITGLNICN